MHRSELLVDLGALRRNVRTLLNALEGSELWAVVKADAYGHGAADAAGAALGAGATALCVATVPEGLALRRDFATARIIVLGPAGNLEVGHAHGLLAFQTPQQGVHRIFVDDQQRRRG